MTDDLNLDSLIANLRQGAEDFCNSRAVVNLSSRDYESAAEELERLREDRNEARRERDEARDVMHSVVEEFVQHGQPSHPRHQPTPIHECEFRYAPERGKCDACEAWADYVRICHPLADTKEEDE
jgi:hypothetical protein